MLVLDGKAENQILLLYAVYFLFYIRKQRDKKLTKLDQTQACLPIHTTGMVLHLYSLSNEMDMYLGLVQTTALLYHVLKSVLAC
jgi:hypothetical protein